MKERKFLLLAVLAATIIIAGVVLRAQDKNDTSRPGTEKVKERLSKWPVVDYDSPELSEPEKRAKRREKNKAFNSPNRMKFDPASPLDRGALNNDWEFGLASTLPAMQSVAIIIGEVTEAQAYLSEDKTNIYSEFTVRVEEVLKNDGAGSINAGELVVTERQGGRVRFPAGRIENSRVAGQNPPEAGLRYVFFLGFNPYDAGTKSLTGPRGNMSRHILTAYEIRENRIYPLDFATGKDFREHQGKDAASFLDAIRRSLSIPSQSSPE